MRYFRRLFYKPKHAADTGGDYGIYRSLAPSVAGIALCTACLCGTSWAWFTATATTGVESIQTATLAVATVTGEDNAVISGTSANGGMTYELTSGKAYSVKLEPGTSQTGYCVITFGDATNYTPQLTKTAAPDGITITVYASDTDKALTVVPQWGTCSYAATIENGGAIGTAPGESATSVASEDSDAVSAEPVSASGEEGGSVADGSSSTEESASASGDSPLSVGSSSSESSGSTANADAATDAGTSAVASESLTPASQAD